MQKFLFIIINISTCFVHLYAHLQEYRCVYYCIWCSALGVVAEVLRSRCVVLCTVSAIGALSCKHCRSGKAVSITYFEYLFVALVILHAMRMRRIVIRALSVCRVFFNITS